MQCKSNPKDTQGGAEMNEDYLIPINIQGEQIEVFTGACKFIEKYKNDFVLAINRTVCRELPSVLHRYLATMFCLTFFNDKNTRQQYKLVKKESDVTEGKQTMPSTHHLHKYHLIEKGKLSPKMKFSETMREFTGREFFDFEKWETDKYKYRNTKLNEEKYRFYRIEDEMQILLNINIREIIRNALRKRNFYYFYQDERRQTSFRSMRADTFDAVLDNFEEWFIENTKLKDIATIKDVMAKSPYSNMTIEELFTTFKNDISDIHRKNEFKVEWNTKINDTWTFDVYTYIKNVY